MTILRKLLTYYVYMVSLFFVGRMTLFVLYFDRIRESEVDHWLSFLHGLRMDTITACSMLLIPAAILTLSPRPAKKGMNTVLRIYFLAIFILILFMEQATLPFLAEYDVRPNYLFLEYLAYPREVFSMLWADYPVLLIVTGVGLVAFSWIFLRLTRQAFLPALEVSYIRKVALLLPVMLVLAVGIRSSFGHGCENKQ